MNKEKVTAVGLSHRGVFSVMSYELWLPDATRPYVILERSVSEVIESQQEEQEILSLTLQDDRERVMSYE